MKNQKPVEGEKARSMSVSFSPESWEYVNRRIAENYPLVNGLSHYFRILIEWDRKEGILEKLIKRPFEKGVVALAE